LAIDRYLRLETDHEADLAIDPGPDSVIDDHSRPIASADSLAAAGTKTTSGKVRVDE
jgi:hypothetical protein